MTFLGRDILAPVAANIAMGIDLKAIGEPQPHLHENLIPNPFRAAGRLLGRFLMADSFGNLISNIHCDDLHEMVTFPRVLLSRHTTGIRWVETYSQAAEGDCVTLVGSFGRVEIAIVNGDASKVFPIGTTSIELSW